MGVGDISGGKHARDAALKACVDEDAVGDGDPGQLGQLDAWACPTPTTTKSQSIASPALVRTRSTRSAPSKASTVVPGRIRTP